MDTRSPVLGLLNSLVGVGRLKDCQVDLELTINHTTEPTPEQRLHQHIVLTSHIVPMSRRIQSSRGVLVDESESLSRSIFSKVCPMCTHPWEVHRVEQLCEHSLSAIDISEHNFFHELALDSGDFHVAFGVVGLTDHDALLSR